VTLAGEGVLTAVARLDDGRTAETARLVSASGFSDQVDVQLAEVHAVVVDDAGLPLADLGRDDFSASLAGASRPIQTFATGAGEPLTLAFALDLSDSMGPALPAVRFAASKFLHTVLRPGDRAILVGFGDRVELLADATGDLERLDAALAGLAAAGRTALWDALLASALRLQVEPGRKALLVVSDGADTASRFSEQAAAEAVARAGIPVYLIGLGGYSQPDNYPHRRIVERLVRDSGGSAEAIHKIDDLAKVYAHIAEDLRSQYLLGLALQPGDDPAALAVASDRGHVRASPPSARKGSWKRRPAAAPHP
jgi:VWFA-related protein